MDGSTSEAEMSGTHTRFEIGSILFWGLLVLGGCATNHSAPFHMYSSPLIEGDGSSPDSGFSSTGVGHGGRPGVSPNQVYTYRRWHLERETPGPSRELRPGNHKRPIYDTVEPLDRPVLANYPRRSALGAGSVRGGESPDTEALNTDLPAENLTEDTDPSTLTEAQLSAGARYISAVLKANEVDLGEEATSSIPELYRACRAQGEIYHSNRPNIGDILFFHNTEDINQDGRNNDWYTLVGIIEAVRRDGTIDFLVYHRGQVGRRHINLDEAGRHSSTSGEILNSRLRIARDDDPPFTQYLAGQLFAGFCNILGDRQELVVIDHWSPNSDD